MCTKFSRNMKYLVVILVLYSGFLYQNRLGAKLESQEQFFAERNINLDSENQDIYMLGNRLPNYEACICKGGECVMEDGKEVCKCPPGFINVSMKYCMDCECGPDSNCTWLPNLIFGSGPKVCLCKLGYNDEKGKCVAKPNTEECRVWFPLGLSKELDWFCYNQCVVDDNCGKGHKCFIKSRSKMCVRTCTVDDDCEYPLKCLKNNINKNTEEKFCYWKSCTKDYDCNTPLICQSTFFGKLCTRRGCWGGKHTECKDNQKCHPKARGCQCADGLSGSNCNVEEWCKDNGKFKDCKGGNGTCKYIGSERAVNCICTGGKKLHPEENRCRATCANTIECKNGGVCEEKGGYKFCSCKLGLIGDMCETVFDCTPDGKYKDCENSGGKCFYDVRKAMCECSGNRKLNDKEIICEVCECGPQGVCRFVEGQKKCDCEQGLIEIDGTCGDPCKPNPCKNDGKCEITRQGFKCNCTRPWIGETCEAACICRGGKCILEGGKGVCKCPPGFGNFTNISCKACDCGPDTNCIWEARFGGNKICLCKPGYSTKKGKCVACECGPDTSCEWISEGWLKPEKKVCHCKPGYHEEDGKCVGPCSDNPCKNGGTCQDVENGYMCLCPSECTEKNCTLSDNGTSSLRNTTTSLMMSTAISTTVQNCHCGPFSYSCSLDLVCNKVCSCFMGYSQIAGICTVTETTSSEGTTVAPSTILSSTMQDCHCGSFSYSCSLDLAGKKACSCYRGYSQLGGSCEECNCGPHGTCSFEYGRKKCICRSFATERNGVCVDKQDLRKMLQVSITYNIFL